nr:MBL fold metallo-hydrolase [uncultured Desulfobulbus sp.]
MFRFLLGFFSVVTIVLFSSVLPLQAQAPMAATQSPGFYRMQLGDFEITALYDGAVQLDTKLLRNINPQELNPLLEAKFVQSPKMQTAVNGYLINTGNHLVLIDTGASSLFGPTLGFIHANLKASGYKPEEIDTIIFTHMHADHIGGLVNEDDEPLYPQAQVFVARQEADYWLSAQRAAKAPENRQHVFAIAREVTTPYRQENRWHPFSENSEIVPGIRSMAANGHTPGHTGFLIESKGQRLFIWGDIVHAHAVQFARPEVSIEFDTNPVEAVATRKALLAQLAASGDLVAGMHLPFPGLGHVHAEGKEKYSWVPIELTPLPFTHSTDQ